ncbi:hypothetical protein HY522_05885, partial [bacterium]|nr:hypothetical protein [bacterium]
MAPRGKKNGNSASQSAVLTDREVGLLLQTLKPDETQFVKLCEQNDVAKPSEVAEVLAAIPPGAPRDHVGSLLLKAGKISQLEYNVLLGQSMAPPPPAPSTSGSPTVAMPAPQPVTGSAPPPPGPPSASSSPLVTEGNPRGTRPEG